VSEKIIWEWRKLFLGTPLPNAEPYSDADVFMRVARRLDKNADGCRIKLNTLG
jgi:hypothetical protein